MTVLKAEARYIPEMSDVLENSFLGLPGLTEWIVKRDQKYRQRLRLWFATILEQAIPFQHVYYEPQGSSVAIWYPPDTWKTDLLQQLFWIPRLLQITGLRHFREKAAELLAMAQRHPQEPHYYLALLGTAPGHQGKGTGTFLLNLVLNICKEQNIPAYVESNSAAYTFYEKHGFQTIAEFYLPNSNSKMRSMWFDAA